MRKRLIFAGLLSLLLIGVLASGVVGSGALFSDTETSHGNTFTAGTLDLKVDGQDDPNIVSVSLADMNPGDDTGYYRWCLRNAGSLPGKPWVEFSTMANDDVSSNEPEAVSGDSTLGAGQPGELGQYLKPTIGTSPCGWSAPSRLISQWQTGPAHPWGVPGLNYFSGYVYNAASDWPVLGPDQTYQFLLRVTLDANLRNWDGTKWVEVDDNIIQSDRVTFDIVFHLDQAS